MGRGGGKDDGKGREGEKNRGKGMCMGAYDLITDARERAEDMGCEGKRYIEGQCFCTAHWARVGEYDNGCQNYWQGRGIPLMINMRKKVRGGGGRESEVEGSKSLRVRDGMRVRREVIGCPRRFGNKGGVGRGEEMESTSKVTEGSIGINGEGEKEDLRGVEESNNRFVEAFLTSTFIMCFKDMSCSFFNGKWSGFLRWSKDTVWMLIAVHVKGGLWRGSEGDDMNYSMLEVVNHDITKLWEMYYCWTDLIG
jgi:hypothetical protein